MVVRTLPAVRVTGLWNALDADTGRSLAGDGSVAEDDGAVNNDAANDDCYLRVGLKNSD